MSAPMKNLALFLFVFGISMKAFAIIGEYEPKETIPPYVCKISYISSSCSAILVDDMKVITAAHCAKGKEQVPAWLFCHVEKGQHKIQKEPVAIHPNYMGELGDWEMASHDLAIYRLEEPLEFGERPEYLFDPFETQELINTGRCFYTGYGRDNEDNRNSTVQMAKIDGELKQPITSESRKVLVLGKNAIRKGDSGGPVLCKREHEDQFLLVGINSMTTIRSQQGLNISAFTFLGHQKNSFFTLMR